MFRRSSGILMHITSLPNPTGIGSFGKEAYDFVDFLKAAGQSYWQLLPIGPTGYGDSPYQSLSTFAGNVLLIDLEALKEKRLLEEADFKGLSFGSNLEKVDFTRVNENKLVLLRKAYEKGKTAYKREVDTFVEEHKEWLPDYALFMALKKAHDLKSWQEWPAKYRAREEVALEAARKKYEDEIRFWEFLQYIFFKQWHELKVYANKNNIEMIGDIPIYVAEDSSDVWSNPALFLLDRENKPVCVSGCPPDAFSATGQLWGNPIYNWDLMEEQSYVWWTKRIKASYELFDVVRIDHFRGFESYWSIPAGSKTAEKGEWIKGPEMKLFNAIKEQLGDLKIIAEDLGFLTQEVIDFKNASGYPGMKVLEFAFDSKEESDYLPHNYEQNCIVYTGTHDNDTVMGWFKNTNKADIEKAIEYLKLTKEEGYAWGFIRGAWSSVGVVAIAQMQDFLELDDTARMNIPSTIGNNWDWRMKPDQLTDTLTKRIYNMTKLYGRLDKNE
ncbi:MAG: 4-alpha-glucanotransferase [Clostridia bacterium]|nr:4-alpha-glucanotransferase [Clostridia bacterium]